MPVRTPSKFDVFLCKVRYKDCADDRFCIVDEVRTSSVIVFPCSADWDLFNPHEHLQIPFKTEGVPDKLFNSPRTHERGFYVDSTALTLRTSDCIAYLGTISGQGKKLLLDGLIAE